MQQLFDLAKNNIYVGSTDKLPEWSANGDEQGKAIEKVKLMLKNYLELDNVSFLFGSGSSIHLGAVAIRNFPVEVEEYIKGKNAEPGNEGIYEELISVVKKIQAKFLAETDGKIDPDTHIYKAENDWTYLIEDDIIRDSQSKEIAIEFERILNYLIAQDFILDEHTREKREDKIKEMIIAIKEGLFSVCDVELRETPDWLIKAKNESSSDQQKRHGALLEKESKYIFHEKFIKALLQRPLNLRRANIFTANYDLAFEYAFDRLGVHYIDGFSGFHKRYFKPETFEFDLFYPGSTTSGKVQRIEKVVRYFKLHGSLSWISSEKREANNLYGIEEMPLKLISELKKKGEIIVYPSAVKKSYTLDLPYSELFRQFASTITQSQSVLITVGYSFADEHFNDIIFQALSNPTFTLIIVDFKGTATPYIQRIKSLNDSRVIILQGSFFGDFLTLADTLMPDFTGIDNNVKVAKTLNEYFGSSEPSETK
ncbi:SIR2 family protein [Parapedobacter sp. 10938]|uniref:SIR2 family protein n=1 Tax=Parapedobacter flavus TaxID=3110225 RepID=UPI002DB56B93|nr:SIR2 family protein [Parapedobacter sp. 10938]MEC3880257.1 SIR2 family protein [Parapedobacter sp. 10938]